MLPFLRMLHPAASKRRDGLHLEFLRREIEETLDLTGIPSELAALPPWPNGCNTGYAAVTFEISALFPVGR